MNIRVTDEVRIATALLHRRYPEREVFSAREIVRQAEAENLTGGPPEFRSTHIFTASPTRRLTPDAMLLETATGRCLGGRPVPRPMPFRQGCASRRQGPDSLPGVDRVVSWRVLGHVRRGGSDPVPGRTQTPMSSGFGGRGSEQDLPGHDPLAYLAESGARRRLQHRRIIERGDDLPTSTLTLGGLLSSRGSRATDGKRCMKGARHASGQQSGSGDREYLQLPKSGSRQRSPTG